MKRVRARLAKLSVCGCGFTLLREDIKLGAEYVAHMDDTHLMQFNCGGCGTMLKNIPCVYFEPRGSSCGGYLPVEAFEFDEGLAECQ